MFLQLIAFDLRVRKFFLCLFQFPQKFRLFRSRLGTVFVQFRQTLLCLLQLVLFHRSDTVHAIDLFLHFRDGGFGRVVCTLLFLCLRNLLRHFSQRFGDFLVSRLQRLVHLFELVHSRFGFVEHLLVTGSFSNGFNLFSFRSFRELGCFFGGILENFFAFLHRYVVRRCRPIHGLR